MNNSHSTYQKILFYLAYTGLVLAVSFLFYKKGILSVGCIVTSLPAILMYPYADNFKNYYTRKYALLLSVLFIVVLISGLWVSDYKLYLAELQLKIPFLFLAWGLTQFTLSKKHFYILLMVYISATGLIALLSLLNYLQNYEEINKTLTYSHTVPIITGRSHIYYGMAAAFSIFTGVYLYLNPLEVAKKALGVYALLLSVFHLFFILFTANRTGIAAFGGGIFILIIYVLIYHRKYKWYIAGATVFLVLISVLAFTQIKAIQHKYHMTMYDLEQMQNGNPDHYSIAIRMETLKTGWEVFKNNIVFGAGSSEVSAEMKKMYVAQNSKLSEGNRWNPHNQFLYEFTASGIIGGILFIVLYFYPLFTNARRNWLFMTFWMVCFVSFQLEAVLERQLGIAFFIIFWVILQNTSTDDTRPK